MTFLFLMSAVKFMSVSEFYLEVPTFALVLNQPFVGGLTYTSICFHLTDLCLFGLIL